MEQARRGRTISDWTARGCRSSCGAAFPTRQLIDLAVAGTLHRPDVLAAQVQAHAGRSAGRRRWWTTSPASGCSCASSPPSRRKSRASTRTCARPSSSETRSLVDCVLRAGSPRHRTADCGLHLPERAAGAALRHCRRARFAPAQGGIARRHPSPRAAGPRQHPHGHLHGQPHVAGDPRQLDPREPAGLAAAGAAAGRRDQHRWRRHPGAHHLGAAAPRGCIARIPPAPPATA